MSLALQRQSTFVGLGCGIALEEKRPEVKEPKIWTAMDLYVQENTSSTCLQQSWTSHSFLRSFSPYGSWRNVPEGQDYVVATISSIRTLMVTTEQDSPPASCGFHIQSHVPGNSNMLPYTNSVL